MRSVPKLLVLIAFVLPGSTVRAQDTTMYVPAFWVLTEHVTFPSPFEEGWRYWSSVLSAFNPTGQQGVVRRLRGYTSDGPVDFDPSFNGWLIAPGTGYQNYLTVGGDGPGFAAISVPPSFVVTAEVKRLLRKHFDGNVDPAPGPGHGYDLGEGQAPLPVFRELFPAGKRVIAGPVNLGSPRLPEAGGATIQKNLRRVNVTLFNAGDESASFAIRALKLRKDPAPILLQELTLGPKQVWQVNRLPIPLSPDDEDMRFDHELLAWVTIDASQPYLAYVSSVFDDPEPGALPFEVFAPQGID